MNLELTKTYRLRNGTLGLVEELLGDGTFYGTVTAPPTDLRVRVIWDETGASTKRGTAWDLVEEVEAPSDDEPEQRTYHGPDHGKPAPIPYSSDLSRIASALERIADRFALTNTELFDIASGASCARELDHDSLAGRLDDIAKKLGDGGIS